MNQRGTMPQNRDTMSRTTRQQKKPSLYAGSPEWIALRGASKMAILDILIETMRRCEGHADDACDLAEIAYIANPVLEARGDAQIGVAQ
jgi:hypothetical protein